MQIGISEARAKLSRLIERAQNGEEIVITKRGCAIARLIRAGTSGRRIFGSAAGQIIFARVGMRRSRN